MANTVAQNKTTEFCVRDKNDIFEVFKIPGDHNTNWVQSYTWNDSAMRINNGTWVNSAIQIRSRVDNYYSELDIYANSNGYARLLQRNRVGYTDYYETYHQNRWWTRDYNTDTVVTFTIADNRMDACGY